MEKELLYRIIEETAPQITDLSDRIWSYAELSMLEHRSTAAYVEVLKDEGFTVQENLCGIATAFSGSFGSGRPVIGLLGEFDALSGLSQAPGLDHPQPLEAGGCGHGCGHNLLGAGALSAAIAIKRAIAAGLLHGTVVFYGCPGEEGCAGKTFMARDGMFRDLDAALTWHPGDTNEVTVGSNAASIQIEYSFSGIAAHAADDPWNGRSALDAAELMNVGVQFLREHMPPRATIHYAFSDAGCLSPNVVQPTARLIYMIRGATVANAKQLAARVADIAKGAALMTGTTVTSRQIDGTANTLSNQVLEQVLYNNLLAAPLPQYTPEEMDFAQRLKATFGPTPLPGRVTGENPRLRQQIAEKTANGTLAVNNFVIPYIPSCTYSQGSTDVGDVSWLTPTAQITAATWPSGSPGHSWQNVSCGKTSLSHKGMLLAAKVLAGAAADLMQDTDLLEQAQAEFAVSAAQGYDCPIGPEVTPCVEQ